MKNFFNVVIIIDVIIDVRLTIIKMFKLFNPEYFKNFNFIILKQFNKK